MPSTLDLDITSAGLLALVSHATRRADRDTIPGSLFEGDTFCGQKKKMITVCTLLAVTHDGAP